LINKFIIKTISAVNSASPNTNIVLMLKGKILLGANLVKISVYIKK
jgi:hypothetical protein